MKKENLEKVKRIIEKLEKGNLTANEVISLLYLDDLNNHGKDFLVENRGWRYYVHLNKLFAPMEKDYLIYFTGEYRLGESGKMEKVWRI